jgi:Helicase conserved C-terminal domain/Type III restriction enzyme, res subunit
MAPAPLPLFSEVMAALAAAGSKYDAATIKELERLRVALATKRRDPRSDAAPVYPDIDSPDFHQRLIVMRNFYSLSNVETKRVLADSGVRARTLLRHQRFVKAYMSPATGYNGLLLVHATGSGKTCTATAVAEMYRPMARHPALILTKTMVRAEFENEVARADDAVWTKDGWTIPPGCGGAQYQRVVAMVKTPDHRDVREALDGIIAKNYKFSGYDEFTNEGERIERTGGEAALRMAYSDRVIIVDEAHNLRSDNNSKRSADFLARVLRMCSNVKLLLLTATPMFDRPKEIAFLLNLLRINDGRSEIDADAMFDGDGNLVDEAGLEAAAQGYVSFARADFKAFPARVASHEAMGTSQARWPRTQYDGTPVKDLDAVQDLSVHPCVLGDAQARAVRALLGARVDAIETEDDKDVMSRLGPATQSSNALIKTPDGLLYGERALLASFKQNASGVVQYSHRDPGYRPFSRTSIRDTAPKIANMIECVSKCEGIAFVYTYWIHGGAIPVALALEEHGFTRFGGPPMLSDRKAVGDKGSYVLLTGRADLMGMAPKDLVRIATRRKNKDGSQIKVIIGTSTIQEGITFQNVREVHILDAWWNTARAEQVIGRAMRYLSHAALEPDKKNVTVFNHVAQLPGDVEGIDHYMYRTAAVKQREVGRVMRILRDTAVDCAWNRDQLVDDSKDRVKLRTSQGRVITRVAGTRDGDPECFYGKCTPPCKHALLAPPGRADSRLYRPLSDDVDIVRAVLEAAFAKRSRLNYDDITAVFPGVDDIVLQHCIAEIVREGVKVNGGRLTLLGDVYSIDRNASRAHPTAFAAELPAIEDASRALHHAKAEFAEAARACKLEGMENYVLEAALDRASLHDLVEVAKDPQYRDAMERGGLLRDGAVCHPSSGQCFKDGKECDRPDPTGVNRPPSPVAVVDASGNFKLLSDSGKVTGRGCATLSTSKVVELARKAGVHVPPGARKVVVCRALELALRKADKVDRPGF